MNDLKALLQEHAVRPSQALDVRSLWLRSQQRTLLSRLRRAAAVIGAVGLVAVPVQSVLSPADRGGGRLETVAPEPGVDAAPTVEEGQETHGGAGEPAATPIDRAGGASSGARVSGGTPAPAGQSAAAPNEPARPATAGPAAPAPGASTRGRIAFARGPNGNGFDGTRRDRVLVVADAGGVNPRTIVSGLGAISPSWAPGGDRILFNGVAGGGPEDGDLGELWLVRPDGSGLRELGRGASPEWSPDGKSIAYMCCGYMSSSIQVAPVGPDGVPVLEKAVAVTPGRFDLDPTWSPDGRRIAFVRSYELAGEAGVYEIWTVDADGENEKKLAEVQGSPPMYSLQDGLSWSPDGRRLAFACGDLSLCLVDAATGSVSQVPAAAGNAPAWMDANSLLFACAGQARQSICRINADGTNLRHLTTGGVDWDYTPAIALR